MNEPKSDAKTGAVQPTRHLLIAGTGRAGTSFLVRYLTELGLDTTLSRSGEEAAFWDNTANAGLEEIVTRSGENLPYVVKSPWMGEYFEEILANPHLSVDAILIPVRDLVEAATSRTVLEMRAMHQYAPWMAEMDRSWEVWATTPGGVVYSVNPLDQARLLAVSFHNLIWRATQAEIPIYFLAFPRIIQDREYLFRVLHPILPPQVTAEQAYEAHERTADLTKVRVGGEEAATERRTTTTMHRAAESLRPDEVDVLAVRRELVRVRAELQRVSADAARGAGEATNFRLQAERSENKVADLYTAISTERTRAEQARADLAALRNSRTWRATRPVRALLSVVKGKRVR